MFVGQKALHLVQLYIKIQFPISGNAKIQLGFEHELGVFVCEIEKFSQFFKVDALQLFLTKHERVCFFFVLSVINVNQILLRPIAAHKIGSRSVRLNMVVRHEYSHMRRTVDLRRDFGHFATRLAYLGFNRVTLQQLG